MFLTEWGATRAAQISITIQEAAKPQPPGRAEATQNSSAAAPGNGIAKEPASKRADVPLSAQDPISSVEEAFEPTEKPPSGAENPLEAPLLSPKELPIEKRPFEEPKKALKGPPSQPTPAEAPSTAAPDAPDWPAGDVEERGTPANSPSPSERAAESRDPAKIPIPTESTPAEKTHEGTSGQNPVLQPQREPQNPSKLTSFSREQENPFPPGEGAPDGKEETTSLTGKQEKPSLPREDAPSGEEKEQKGGAWSLNLPETAESTPSSESVVAFGSPAVIAFSCAENPDEAKGGEGAQPGQPSIVVAELNGTTRGPRNTEPPDISQVLTAFALKVGGQSRGSGPQAEVAEPRGDDLKGAMGSASEPAFEPVPERQRSGGPQGEVVAISVSPTKKGSTALPAAAIQGSDVPEDDEAIPSSPGRDGATDFQPPLPKPSPETADESGGVVDSEPLSQESKLAEPAPETSAVKGKGEEPKPDLAELRPVGSPGKVGAERWCGGGRQGRGLTLQPRKKATRPLDPPTKPGALNFASRYEFLASHVCQCSSQY